MPGPYGSFPETHPYPRLWPRRLLIAANVVVAFCIVVAGSGYAYLRWRFDQVEKVSFESGVLLPERQDPGGVMNVLLVGSDSRAALTSSADQERHVFDESGRRVTGQRSDTIMILHVDPRRQRAAILSVPRDLWVTIPGTTRKQRVNAAYTDGPRRLIQTLRSELGIDIHHYVGVDFVGFRNMVKAVGGVPIFVPAPARDAYSDLRIDTPGCVTLDGDQALAWVRSRHYRYFEAGRWRSEGTGDFGRIQRQQDFIRRLMKRSIAGGVRDPLKLNRLVDIAVSNVEIDSAMTTKDILKLGNRFRSLDPDTVDMLTLPVTEAWVNGAYVLKLKQPEAQDVINRFNGVAVVGDDSEDGRGSGGRKGGEAPPSRLPPSAVRIRILNGTGMNGQASEAAEALQDVGFNNAGIGDAHAFKRPKTIIHYGSGQRDKALLVRSYLKEGAQLREDTTLKSVDLVLVTGWDYAGVATPGSSTSVRSATPATTTTVTTPARLPANKGASPWSQC